MSKNKKQSFVQGALILVVAALLVKFIGFFFKIPLTFLIKDDGMGLFNSAYQIYTIMFVVATAGFPTAISKMVAESLALNRRQEADRVFKVAICILAVIGIVGSLFLFVGAEAIAGWIKNTRALMAIRAIAPAVLCVSFMAVFRGYFQGRRNMYPTAISEVTEAMGKLIFGYLFAWMFRESVIKASAGAVFGVTMGTVLGFFSLFAMYLLYKKTKEPYMPGEITDSYKNITKKLIRIAVPITIGASVSSLTNLADMFTVMRRLQDITELTPEFMAKYGALIENIKDFDGVSMNEQLANSLYGMYTGKALTLFNFPLTMVVALGMSVVPVIAGTLAKKDTLGAQNAVNTVLKLTILFAIPCAIGMYVLASPILQVVFHDDLSTTLLQKLAISIIFVSLLQITTSILQAYGRTVIPVINMIIGGIIKVVINYHLVAVPGINIDGAPIGTMVCYFTVMALNMIWIIKETKCKFNLMEYIVKPVFAGAVMGVVTHFLYIGVSGFGTVAALGVSVIAAVFVYLATLLVVRAFKEDDIRMLPKGEKVLKLFRKFHLM
ncbi:MAG: polysaccharide biosynthesis protein [Clostridia bacterium]|nr:polysaccharide biosynthesis protein [Clostridia bacterium]